MKQREVWYTDGSSENTKGDESLCASAIVCPSKGLEHVAVNQGTNNKAELTACAMAANLCELDAVILTDSQYVARIANGEAVPKVYVREWLLLLDLLKTKNIKVDWVRGHAKDTGNRCADKLAHDALRQEKLRRAYGIQAR